MEEQETNLYETKTSLISCENVVEYLWTKATKTCLPFKPENAKSIEAESIFSDVISGNIIKRDYVISNEDIKRVGLKKEEEYEVDTVNFKNFDENKQMISEGTLLVIYKSEKRFYTVFLLKEEDDRKELTLLIKSFQKKKMFQSYTTETNEFF